MQADVKHLKEQYAMLSDDALLAMDREELVEEAQVCYDAELRSRDLEPARTFADEEGEERPEWLADAAQVFSSVAVPGTASADDAMAARDALKAAGIPCFLELHELPQQTEVPLSVVSHEWRVMVPGKLNLRATSVLEAELYFYSKVFGFELAEPVLPVHIENL